MGDLVSVIIPAYNAETHLPRALKSVLSQTHEAVEIIVIDDGSLDETVDICGKYGDQIRYFYQKNKGVSSARNRGIQEARGEFIAFLDADDEWKPYFLELLLGHLRDNPEVSATTGAQIFVSSESERIHPDDSKYQFDRVVDYYDIFGRGPNFVHTSSAVYRKSVVDVVGGFTSWMRHNEDTEFFIRISMLTDWYVSSEPLSYYYLDVQGSATEGLGFDQRIRKAFCPQVLKVAGYSCSDKLFYRVFMRNKYRRLAPTKYRYKQYRHFLHRYVLTGVRQTSSHTFACDCLWLSLYLGLSISWFKNCIRVACRVSLSMYNQDLLKKNR